MTKKPNPDHYPPNDLPTISDDELKAIREKPAKLLTDDDVDKLTAERDRASRKIGLMKWGPKRPDAEERAHSATGTWSVAGLDRLLKLELEERRKKREGGKKRKGQSTTGGNNTRAAIKRAEDQLRADGKPLTNAAIARLTHKSVDHIRKLRSKRAKS
jgi:hypothetical protein